MSILVVVKVSDGIALATDSAVVYPDDRGGLRTFATADKLLQLHDELPVAVLVTGTNAIGHGTVQFWTQVLKRAFTGTEFPSYTVDTSSYQLKEIAAKATQVLGESIKKSWDDESYSLGLVFAGYSSDSLMPEVWEVAIRSNGTVVEGPTQTLSGEETGIRVYGQPQVAERIIYGFDRCLMAEMVKIAPRDALVELLRKNQWNVLGPYLPLPDAASLARYFVEATAGISPYVPSQVTVRHPVDVATLSKHNGFRWIDRKDTY